MFHIMLLICCPISGSLGVQIECTELGDTKEITKDTIGKTFYLIRVFDPFAVNHMMFYLNTSHHRKVNKFVT